MVTAQGRGHGGVVGWMAALALLLMAAAMTTGCEKPAETPRAQPPTVLVAQVQQRDVPLYGEWIGSTEGMVNAQISAQVSGYLVKQAYQEGSFVKKDQLLFKIDPRTFQAALAQAKGELALAQARQLTAKANLDKILPLAKVGAVSEKDRDDAIGNASATEAQVVAARAKLQKAELDLDFTSITSPIGGIAGLAQAQIGDLVGPQSAALTTVSQLDPIKVYVNISEQEYLAAMRENVGPREEREDNLELTLADGSVFPNKGRMIFADRQVDPRTGTIKVAATFANPDYLLRPGQYAKVRALLRMQKGALLVPQRAVQDVQGHKMVVVVSPQNTAETRPVKVGEQVGGDWLIEAGLKPGETVVVEGAQKVRPGLPVRPEPYGQGPAAPAGQR